MTIEEHDKAIIDRAAYFTAIRGANPRTRVRKELPSLAEAVAWAEAHGDKRTMIYAVTKEGRSVFVRGA
jgi:hypothetical protein